MKRYEVTCHLLHADCILSPYHSTCAVEQITTCSRSAGMCSPEVKQVEVTCHLMHADFFLSFFYTVA